MFPELVKWGPITINSYGFMIATGFLFAVLLASYRTKRLGLNADIIFSLGMFGIIGGFAGAKLLFYITEIRSIYENPRRLLNISNGFVVFGGIIGGVLTGYIYCRVKKVGFLEYFDVAAPSIALAQVFGRIECFMAGCCYGKETTCSIGVVFHHSLLAPNGVRLIPTQLFSSAGDFLLAIVLLLYAKRKVHHGEVAWMYLILYSAGRFFIETMRDDPRGSMGILSTSQFISIFTFVIGLCLYYFTKRGILFSKARKAE